LPVPSITRLTALAVLATMISACSRSVSPSELPGTYVMNRGQAADTIFVRSDGTYLRRLVLPGEAPVSDTGQWQLEPVAGEERIVFAKLRAKWPGLREESPPGYWPVRTVLGAGGQVRLPVDEDLGWAYVRLP